MNAKPIVRPQTAKVSHSVGTCGHWFPVLASLFSSFVSSVLVSITVPQSVHACRCHASCWCIVRYGFLLASGVLEMGRVGAVSIALAVN